MLHLYLTQNNCNGSKGKVEKKKDCTKKVPKIASNIAKLDLTNGNFDLDKIQLRIVHCASELLRYLHTNSIPSKFQSKMHYCQTMQSKRPRPHWDILLSEVVFLDLHWEKNLTWMWNFRNLCEGSPAEVVHNYGFSVMHLEESPQKIDVIITKRITDIM